MTPQFTRALCWMVFVTTLGLGTSAHAVSITYTASASSSDGPVSAQATITTSAGHVHVDVMNLINDPTSAGQGISAIDLVLSGGQTTGSVFTSLGIPVTPISGGGAYVGGQAATSMSWTLGTSAPAGALQLCGIANCGADHGGGIANSSYLIIGGPNASNVYASANSSITNRSPLFAAFTGGPAQFPSAVAMFDFNVAGVTASSTITAAAFNFGTEYTEHYITGTCTSGCGDPPSVPEPSTFLLLGSGLAGLAAWRWRKHSA